MAYLLDIHPKKEIIPMESMIEIKDSYAALVEFCKASTLKNRFK